MYLEPPPSPPNAAIEALPCQVVRSQIKYPKQTEPDLEGSSELSTTFANTGATASSPPTSQAHLRCFDEEERAEVTEGFWTEMSVLHDWDSMGYGPEYLSLEWKNCESRTEKSYSHMEKS